MGCVHRHLLVCAELNTASLAKRRKNGWPDRLLSEYRSGGRVLFEEVWIDRGKANRQSRTRAQRIHPTPGRWNQTQKHFRLQK